MVAKILDHILNHFYIRLGIGNGVVTNLDGVVYAGRIPPGEFQAPMLDVCYTAGTPTPLPTHTPTITPTPDITGCCSCVDLNCAPVALPGICPEGCEFVPHASCAEVTQ